MTVAEYMNLRCCCGSLRREHYHAYDDYLVPGTISVNPHPIKLRVLGNSECTGFTWEMELELGGNPLTNKHLRPLTVDGD